MVLLVRNLVLNVVVNGNADCIRPSVNRCCMRGPKKKTCERARNSNIFGLNVGAGDVDRARHVHNLAKERREVSEK